MRKELARGLRKDSAGRICECTSTQAMEILGVSRSTLRKHRELLQGEERIVEGKITWVFPRGVVLRYKPPKGFAPPSVVAKYLMISRQALHDRIKRGTYPIYRRDPFPAWVWHPGIDLSKPEHRR